MPKMKMSYKDIRRTFHETAYGPVYLELAVGQEQVIVRDSQGIKATLQRQSFQDAGNILVRAAMHSDEAKFNSFLAELATLDA